MPRREVHEMIDQLLFGKKFTHVHMLKDFPSKFLGARHRVLFHDNMTNLLIGMRYGSEALLSAYLHDLVDFATTEAKKKKTKSKKRKKRKKRKRKVR